MKLNFWIALSLNIFILGMFYIFISFIPEINAVKLFLGDFYCTDLTIHYGDKYNTPHWHWGYRHWVWMFMGIILGIIQIIRIIQFAENKKKYDKN